MGEKLNKWQQGGNNRINPYKGPFRISVALPLTGNLGPRLSWRRLHVRGHRCPLPLMRVTHSNFSSSALTCSQLGKKTALQLINLPNDWHGVFTHLRACWMKSPISNFYCLHRAESNILTKSLPLYTHKLIKKHYLFQRTGLFLKSFYTFQACVKPPRYFLARGAVTPKEPTRLKPFTHAHEQTRFAVSLWRTHFGRVALPDVPLSPRVQEGRGQHKCPGQSNKLRHKITAQRCAPDACGFSSGLWILHDKSV